MSPFLRIGLSNFDCGSCQSCQSEAINPYCAVLVKEYVESGISPLSSDVESESREEELFERKLHIC